MAYFVSCLGIGMSLAAISISCIYQKTEHRIGYSIIAGIFLIAAAIASRP